VINEAIKNGQSVIQDMINEALRRGHDCNLFHLLLTLIIVPDELKDRLKTSDIGKDLNIEQKMSLRDKQKAKKRAEEEEERLLYEQTGLKDKSKDFSMDNLIKKFQFDMER